MSEDSRTPPENLLEAFWAAAPDPVLVDPYEALRGAYETGTDPFEWIRANGYQRHGALTRKARNLRANMRAARVAQEREERARAREARRNRIDALGRMVRCAGASLSRLTARKGKENTCLTKTNFRPISGQQAGHSSTARRKKGSLLSAPG